jgi:hypothetical protein
VGQVDLEPASALRKGSWSDILKVAKGEDEGKCSISFDGQGIKKDMFLKSFLREDPTVYFACKHSSDSAVRGVIHIFK